MGVGVLGGVLISTFGTAVLLHSRSCRQRLSSQTMVARAITSWSLTLFQEKRHLCLLEEVTADASVPLPATGEWLSRFGGTTTRSRDATHAAQHPAGRGRLPVRRTARRRRGRCSRSLIGATVLPHA